MLDKIGLGDTLLERADGHRLYGIFLFYFDGLISLSFYFLTFSCISFVDMQICPRREGVDLEGGVESCTIGINRGLPALP